MLRRDADLSDPVVLLWDAVASGETLPARDENTGTLNIISEFLALDDAPMPDPTFLNRLEGQVIRTGKRELAPPEQKSNPLRTLHVFSPGSWRAAFPSESEPRSRLSGYGRWVAAQAAIAVLLLIAIGSVGIIYLTDRSDDGSTIPAFIAGGDDATPQPGTAQAETLASVVVDPGSVGADSAGNWQAANLVMVRITAGEQFVLDESNWSSGLDLFSVLSGEISVESGSNSQVLRAGNSEPDRLSAGNSEQLSPGDSWVAGIGNSLTVANNGNEDADLVFYYVGVETDLFMVSASFPQNFRRIGTAYAEDSDIPAFSGPLVLTLERVSIDESDEYTIEVSDGESAMLIVEEGRSILAAKNGSIKPLRLEAGSALHEFGAGTYTFKHFMGEPEVLYIVQMRNNSTGGNTTAQPVTPGASPVASAALAEPLASFLADPAAFPIGNPEEWDQIVFEYGYVEPGDSYDATLLDVTCCRSGLAALHIVGGSMNIELSGPANVIRAGQDPSTPEVHEPSTAIVLGAGDTIWYGIETVPVVTNPGTDRLSLLKLSAYLVPGEGTEMGGPMTTGYSSTSMVYTNDNIPLQPGVVSLSLQQIALDPEASSTLTLSENQRLMALIGQGVIQYHKDTGATPPPPSLTHSRGQGHGVAFHTFSPGDYIIENNEDEPAVLYVLTMTTIPD